MPLFPDREVTSVADLLLHIKSDEADVIGQNQGGYSHAPPIWYRGLRKMEHELVPTLHRAKIPVEDEIHVMNRFRQNAHEFLESRPAGEWEWMFLMRHHGLPSRLLDWSESPLIGLYFAIANPQAEDEPDLEHNGVLWCLLPTKLNEVSTGGTGRSDLVPMFADGGEDQNLFGQDFISLYLPSNVSTGFRTTARMPVAGFSIRTTRRIQAQHGVFTIHHAGDTALNDVGDGSHIWRFTIPSTKKPQLLEELRLLRINRLTVFPDLDNVAVQALEGL